LIGKNEIINSRGGKLFNPCFGYLTDDRIIEIIETIFTDVPIPFAVKVDGNLKGYAYQLLLFNLVGLDYDCGIVWIGSSIWPPYADSIIRTIRKGATPFDLV
jgi:hypothetical protein